MQAGADQSRKGPGCPGGQQAEREPAVHPGSKDQEVQRSFHSAIKKTMSWVLYLFFGSLRCCATLCIFTRDKNCMLRCFVQRYFLKRKLDHWYAISKTDLEHRRTRLTQWQTWQDVWQDSCHIVNAAVATGDAACCLQDHWGEFGSGWLFLKLDGADMWHTKADRW